VSTLAARLPSSDAAKLRDTARVVGWGLAIYAGAALVNAYLKQNPTGSLAVQAVVVEFGAGRLAVAWSDPRGPIPTLPRIGRRAGVGALLGAGAAALVILFATATHGATLASTTPTLSMLTLGLLIAGLTAMRDELLLRGVVLRALEQSAPAGVGLVVCGLAGAAATVGTALAAAGDSVVLPWHESLIAGLMSVCFALLWKRDRGAWQAWGAHAAWLWITGPVAHGGLIDLRWKVGSWGGGDLNAGNATAVVLAFVMLSGLLWSRGHLGQGSPAERPPPGRVH
jgi:hypothetical protein